MAETVLQKARQWMKLQEEFGENWILTEHPEVLSDVCTETTVVPPQRVAATDLRPPIPKAEVSAQPPREVRPSTQSSASGSIPPIEPSVRAVEATSLDELKAKLLAFDGCSLKKLATHTVFANGDSRSPLMFVGEAPGADEDLQGVPFVGASGQLLNKMLAAIHIQRSDVYVTNVVNWRPPGNRPPTPDEIASCLPFLERHIALVAPKFLVLLGGTAMKAVLRRTGSLSQARGIWHSYRPVPDVAPIRTLVTFHPSYLLRSPGQKTLAWQDLQMLQGALNQEGLFLGSEESVPSVDA